MKSLIAISSCWDFETKGFHNAQRYTWLPEVAKFPDLDYKYFVGVGQGAESAALPDDMVLLPDVDDGYNALTYKTRASLRWAHERDYSFVFRLFPDGYCVVDRLMRCGFEETDYYGHFAGNAKHGNYAPGGAGYWLSRKAFTLLIGAPILGSWIDAEGKARDEVTVWAEDLWVGRILKDYPDLTYKDDWARFVNHGSRYFPTRGNEVITSHLSCPYGYTGSEHMWAAHNSYIHS